MEMRTAVKQMVDGIVAKVVEAAKEMPKQLGIRFSVRPNTQLITAVHQATHMTCEDLNDPQKVAARLSMLRDDVDNELAEMEVLKYILHANVAGTTKELEGVRFTKGNKQFRYKVQLVDEHVRYVIDAEKCRTTMMPRGGETVYEFLVGMGLVKETPVHAYVKADEKRIKD